MLWFICIVFIAIAVGLLAYLLRVRQLVRELTGAISARRSLLNESSDANLRLHGMKDLIDAANELIDQHQTNASQNVGYTKQIELMLRAVQEVVIIFDEKRTIEFANRAAELLFNGGKSMQDQRLDSTMRSLSLLEFLRKDTDESNVGDNQIRIETGDKVLWFEASCSQVRSITQPRELSSLLVLHDITRLKSLEVMRREFVANVSHELRTPLTIIKGFAETLVDDHESLPVEMRARYLSKVLNNAERLHMLVEDLLTLSRLESLSDEFEPVEHSLQALLEDVREDFTARLNPDQEIVLVCDENLPSVAFDRFRIHQVLDNLVSNAFRYAPEFTLLSLKLHYDEESHSLVCAVRDDGPGIPKEDLEHIFERFYRVDKGRSQERGGTGLGLSIVKHIVQMHGGKVSADSKLGEWTQMSFHLPCVEEVSEVADVI